MKALLHLLCACQLALCTGLPAVRLAARTPEPTKTPVPAESATSATSTGTVATGRRTMAGNPAVAGLTASSTGTAFAPFHFVAAGMSNKKVSCIAEDAQGHIWMGTFRGLNRYNVYEYHQYFATDDTTSLPDNQVTDLMRDSHGRLWVATVAGVALYTDQDRFQRIPTHIGSSNKQQFLETSTGRILLNLSSSLCAYDPQTERMQTVIPNLDAEGAYFLTCHTDPANQLWVVSARSLRCYDATTLELRDSIGLNNNPLYSYLHTNGDLWMAGDHKLVIYDTRRRQMKDVPAAISQHPKLGRATVTLIHPYGRTGLLLVTDNQGMYYYNAANGTVTHQWESGFPFLPPLFRVSTLYTDSHDNLWIGSVDQGFKVIYSYKDRFSGNSPLGTMARGHSVVGMALDTVGHSLWLASLNDGLWRYDLDRQKVEVVPLPHSLYDGEDPPQVEYIYVDREGMLWMNVGYGQVARCRYSQGRLQVVEAPYIILPRYFLEDREGTLWIATSTGNLYARRRGQRDFTTIRLVPLQRINFIPTMTLLDDGRILAAAFQHPIKIIDPTNWSITDLDVSAQDWQDCISRSVFIPVCSRQDSRGDIWIGTITNGLLHYDAQTHRMHRVEGLPCSDISAVEEDAQGGIWVSSLYGLSRWDRTVDRWTHYFEEDGTGGNQFSERTSCCLPDGTIILGGTHGLTFFNPIDVRTQRTIPLLFEDLKVHNRLIAPGGPDGCIDRHLAFNPTIHLTHRQNAFSISFAALDYSEHERVHYFYMLEGQDQDWVDAHNNREAYYANLPSGRYTLRVRITNNDQSIVEAENAIRVIIHPAPWQSWWAWTGYVLLAIAALWLLWRNAQRFRRARRATRLAQEEREQERRLNEMNMNFFANVSHEFRTPLTMIAGPVATLSESPRLAGDDRELLLIVRRNVDRMLRLVGQLLDFNRLQGDKLRLEVRRQDIVALTQSSVSTFATGARQKGIQLTTRGLVGTYLTWVDADKLDKILSNLLGNALKYTPKGGQVEVALDTSPTAVTITVSDNGPGVPDEEKEAIFQRYYQMENRGGGAFNWGTGIGLYYARGLAGLHHGTLTVSDRRAATATSSSTTSSPAPSTAAASTPRPDTSAPGVTNPLGPSTTISGQGGAVFTLVLPTADEAYTAAEKRPSALTQEQLYPATTPATAPATAPTADATTRATAPPQALDETQAGTSPASPASAEEGPSGAASEAVSEVLSEPQEGALTQPDRKLILVVDDDTEVAFYLRTLLSARYRVCTCLDADAALQAMAHESPDLVLSDVVMPGKDGYQLCQIIKDDLSLCHIPVVLLTARVTVESQVTGLNTGADAYVTKPFDPSYLMALIGSLLANRDRVRTLLSQATEVDPRSHDALSPQDNAFMTDLYRLMEAELADNDLDINRMTSLLCISRSKFYYKVKGLTGQNPAAFFRTYKLNRAAQLIREGKYTIAEIAALTGWSTPSHFTSSFKKQFGVTPTNYR